LKIGGGYVYNKALMRIFGLKREEAADIKEGYMKKGAITSCHVFHQPRY
jgi:hypothetical protein